MGKEKKEIWIEKLIELLNEYKKIKWYDWNTKITNYDTDTGSFTNGYSWLEYEIVIGKRYGFIKRLVENDKIDYEMEMDTLPFREKYDIKKSDFLIMLLSISDEPISDLISYLK